HPDLHSFPTRRSSDLDGRLSGTAAARAAEARGAGITTFTTRAPRDRRARHRHGSAADSRIRWPREQDLASLIAEDLVCPTKWRIDRKSTRLNSSHVEI